MKIKVYHNILDYDVTIGKVYDVMETFNDGVKVYLILDDLGNEVTLVEGEVEECQ